jgi:hypothetical protein
MSQANHVTASQELLDAWNHYHQTLEQSRLDLEQSSRFQQTPQHRAKAYHCLMEVQAMAYNFIIGPRMLHPRIHFNTGWQTNMYTLGQNGQDFLYGVLFVDGKQQYRLSGRMGDISVFLLQTHNGVFGEEGVNITGNYDWADFEIDSDGRFDITMSAEKVEGNWIQLDPDSGYQFMLIRRAMPDWNGDRGELTLDRISDLPDDAYDHDEFDESAIATRIHRAADFVRYMIHDFTLNLYSMYAKNCGDVKNKLVLIPGTESSQVGSPSSNYAMAVFELADDEALVIEMDQCPDGTYWSFQAGDVWSRSLDFSSRQSSLNNQEVTVNRDGSILIVASNQDPGVQNWLDTCGRCEGTIVFRNYRAQTRPVPNSRKVKISELPALLQNQVKVSPEERKAAMKVRRAAQLSWYGE